MCEPDVVGWNSLLAAKPLRWWGGSPPSARSWGHADNTPFEVLPGQVLPAVEHLGTSQVALPLSTSLFPLLPCPTHGISLISAPHLAPVVLSDPQSMAPAPSLRASQELLMT